VSNIPGSLDTAALARLHFTTLTQREQATAIRRMAATGHSVYGIAAATGLAVEVVRRVLAGEEAA